MQKLSKILTLLVVTIMVLSTPISVSAAETTKSATRTFTYYDSLVPSLVVGKMTTTYTWTYDSTTQKLVDKKAITYNTSDLFVGCFFNNNNTYWAWYDTSNKKGTAKGVHSWTFNFGIPTAWGTVGTASDNNTSVNIVWS